MENRKLPNVTISLVLGIISFIACCFSWGIGGILLSGIGLFLANKDKKTYLLSPDSYDNYGQLKTARTIAIIGLILGVLTLLLIVVMLVMFGGIAGLEEFQRQQMEQAGMGQ